MNKLGKILLLWMCLGMIYLTLEGIWSLPHGGSIHFAMFGIGGLCGILVGSINQFSAFHNLSVRLQSIIGVLIVLLIEGISGYVCNVLLGLNIWDYSDLPFNIGGQVCLSFAFLWLLIMPACIWLEDTLRYTIWSEGKKYSIWNTYHRFFLGEKVILRN